MTTNLGFLRALPPARLPREAIDTGFIDREGAEALAAEPPARPPTLLLAAAGVWWR